MTRRYYYRPWKDASLVSALHFLRCRIIRDGEPGLGHVDVLLRQLGADPEALPLPAKRPDHFKRNELRRAILDALRDGPLRGGEIADRVRGNLDPKLAYKCTYQGLAHMKEAGLVRRDGPLWGLAP